MQTGKFKPIRKQYRCVQPSEELVKREYKKVRIKIVFIALQRTNTENSEQIFPKKELLGHSPNFHIHVSVSDLYIPRIDLSILLQEIVDQSWKYINRSQTHKCG
jgi:hypothetical protein